MKPLHILLAAAVAATWGFNFVVIHVGLGSIPPVLLAASRFVVAAIPALWIPRPNVPWRRLIVIAMVLFVVQFALLYIGMEAGMPPGIASLTLQAQAFFTPLVAAVVLRELPKPRQAVGLAIALAGLAAIATTVGTGGITTTGLVLTLAAAASWAVGNIMLRGLAVDMLALMIWLSVISILPLLAVSWVFEGPAAIAHALVTTGWLGVAAIAYIGVLSTLFGYGAWGYLLKLYPATTVAPFALMVPLFGTVSAVVVLGETFGRARLLGMALILIGLAAIALPVSARRSAS